MNTFSEPKYNWSEKHLSDAIYSLVRNLDRAYDAIGRTLPVVKMFSSTLQSHEYSKRDIQYCRDAVDDIRRALSATPMYIDDFNNFARELEDSMSESGSGNDDFVF